MLLFWLALRSDGCDWYISQTHADAIFTGLRKFGEFPFFSFAFNGGTYFLQDPQSNLFSPVVPLTWLVGPSVALRLMDGIWGGLGVWFFTLWMRRHVRVEAALIGGVASATSLAVLWRIAGGNDMFLWHLGLPALLWAGERLLRERTLATMACFGLVLGVLILGPTFGSFTYLFLPVVPLFLVADWFSLRPSARQFGHTLLLLLGACAIAALIASPKLACWLTFTMRRPVGDYGPIPFRQALRHLFDFSIWSQHTVIAQPLRDARGWGEEETAVALQPVATVLALVGCVSAVWLKRQRRMGILLVMLIALGLGLTCSSAAFHAFRYFSHNGFRVMQRFLVISAFGLTAFTALGADALLDRFRRWSTAFTLTAVLSMFVSVVWWTASAAKFTGKTSCDAVHSVAIRPLARLREERALSDGFQSYSWLRKFPGLGRDLIKGGGLTDGFLIVGNAFEPSVWNAKYALPVVGENASASDPVTVRHLSIVIPHLKPNEHLQLRLRQPAFGLSVMTVPPQAKVNVFQLGRRLVVENRGKTEIESVTLRARWPISRLWLLVSLFGLLGPALLLIFSARRKVVPSSDVAF